MTRAHLIRPGPHTLKGKGVNRTCASGDGDLGVMLGVCLHTFPYYPLEKSFIFLKFWTFPGGLLLITPCKHTIVFPMTLELLQDHSFQPPESGRCIPIFLGLIAPPLIARETRCLKVSGIFLFTFSSCLAPLHVLLFTGICWQYTEQRPYNETMLQASGGPTDIPRPPTALWRQSTQSCRLEILNFADSRFLEK